MRIFRYPVKSMLGEELAAAEVTEQGITGDRVQALIDVETGKVVSAKNPRLWAKMLSLSADAAGWSDDELSTFLGRKVRLSNVPPEQPLIDRASPDDVLAGRADDALTIAASGLGSGFHDFAPIHLVTTSTLALVSEVERYRPNLVIPTDEPGFVENEWVGRQLQVGPEVVLSVIVVTPRCAVPTLAHGSLARDTRALRVPAEFNRIAPLPSLGPQPCVGVYAKVVTPGRIQSGDSAHLL